jgi:hypothetical protein
MYRPTFKPIQIPPIERQHHLAQTEVRKEKLPIKPYCDLISIYRHNLCRMLTVYVVHMCEYTLICLYMFIYTMCILTALRSDNV